MEKTNEGTTIDINKLANISPKTLGSKIDNVQLLVIKKKISDYKEIYIYSIEYIQNDDNENVIDIDKDITIYGHYKGFYDNYKIYDS